LPSRRSTTQHPRTCGPGPRQWARISGSRCPTVCAWGSLPHGRFVELSVGPEMLPGGHLPLPKDPPDPSLLVLHISRQADPFPVR